MHPFTRHLAAYLFFSLTIHSGAIARWATPAEADVAFLNFERKITVKADGQSEEIVTTHMKILNESGREQHGIQRFQYNANSQEFDILEATAVFEGVEYKVPEHMIEKKPLASDASGFDQLYQVIVSFPQIGIGSEIHIKYKETTKKQPLPKYFATFFHFGTEGLWKKAKVTIHSNLPLHLVVNDPHKVLDVKDVTTEGQQNITFTLKKDIYTATKSEPYGAVIPPELLTWCQVSTFDNFEKFGEQFSSPYQEIIDQPLPPLLEDIRKAAEKITNPVDQINNVTSLLAEKIRYMGDWRTIEGKFIPRPLKTIAESGVGDCKDFSAATAAILRKLGYDAHAALVMRGEAHLPMEKELPSTHNANHAMVKAIAKDEKVFWIDPTNLVSMADSIFPDIANRPVLILNPQKITREKTPEIQADHALSLVNKTLELKENHLLHTMGKLMLKGERAIPLTGTMLLDSEQVIGDRILQFLSEESSPLNKKITIPNLTSRIVQDITFDFSYNQENAVLYTNMGNGIMLDTHWCHPYLETDDDQVGNLYVRSPTTSTRTILIKNAKIDNIDHLNYDIKSPWAEAKRQCKMIPEGVEIEDSFKILTSFVSAEDIKSTAYKEFKNNLKKYCTKVAAIVSPSSEEKTVQ